MFLDANMVKVAEAADDNEILTCILCPDRLQAGDPVVIRGNRFAHLDCVMARVAARVRASNLALGDGRRYRFQCNNPTCGTEFVIEVTDRQDRARYVLRCPCCGSEDVTDVTGVGL
jgi:hypothetical protein